MSPDNYVELAVRTVNAKQPELTDKEKLLVNTVLGLSGEVGEVVEHIKKGVFHRHGVDPATVGEELGDVMWYIAILCHSMGISLELVMEHNIKKLKARYPEGFSPEASQNRKEYL